MLAGGEVCASGVSTRNVKQTRQEVCERELRTRASARIGASNTDSLVAPIKQPICQRVLYHIIGQQAA